MNWTWGEIAIFSGLWFILGMLTVGVMWYHDYKSEQKCTLIVTEESMAPPRIIIENLTESECMKGVPASSYGTACICGRGIKNG
jgi:hypothetical protein